MQAVLQRTRKSQSSQQLTLLADSRRMRSSDSEHMSRQHTNESADSPTPRFLTHTASSLARMSSSKDDLDASLLSSRSHTDSTKGILKAWADSGSLATPKQRPDSPQLRHHPQGSPQRSRALSTQPTETHHANKPLAVVNLPIIVDDAENGTTVSDTAQPQTQTADHTPQSQDSDSESDVSEAVVGAAVVGVTSPLVEESPTPQHQNLILPKLEISQSQDMSNELGRVAKLSIVMEAPAEVDNAADGHSDDDGGDSIDSRHDAELGVDKHLLGAAELSDASQGQQSRSSANAAFTGTTPFSRSSSSGSEDSSEATPRHRAGSIPITVVQTQTPLEDIVKPRLRTLSLQHSHSNARPKAASVPPLGFQAPATPPQQQATAQPPMRSINLSNLAIPSQSSCNNDEPLTSSRVPLSTRRKRRGTVQRTQNFPTLKMSDFGVLQDLELDFRYGPSQPETTKPFTQDELVDGLYVVGRYGRLVQSHNASNNTAVESTWGSALGGLKQKRLMQVQTQSQTTSTSSAHSTQNQSASQNSIGNHHPHHDHRSKNQVKSRASSGQLNTSVASFGQRRSLSMVEDTKKRNSVSVVSGVKRLLGLQSKRDSSKPRAKTSTTG